MVRCLSRFVSSKASTFTTQGHAGGEVVGGIVGFVGGSAGEVHHIAISEPRLQCFSTCYPIGRNAT